jgi:hypothetical protein
MPKAVKLDKKATKPRKPKNVPIVASISADGNIQGTFTPEPRRPLIVHLPFRSTEIQFQDGPLVYDPRPPGNPQPYDANEDNLYTSNAERLLFADDGESKQQIELPAAISESNLLTNKSELTASETNNIVEEPTIKAFRTMDVMVEYSIGHETLSLPESVSAACFWCCGNFEGRPVVLPTQEEKGVYSVYGNFCTLSCGLSYLLIEHIDPQLRWERQALFHRMYKQTMNIQPAPPKESLKFFGGCLSHEQYRKIINDNKLRVDINIPPVISILATLDTKPIDFYETSLRNTSTGGGGIDIIKHSEPGLRLKRSKPLKDKESTLDAVMNLQVKVKN